MMTIRTIKLKSLTIASLCIGVAWSASAHAQDRVTVEIDGSKEGRTFEGIGAVSAGASSRLLIDYPVARRNEVLDYLFRPKYGASFQHLKVEIGSDANSTDGSEPSFARTHAEFIDPTKDKFDRGYEFWLMKEARARNGAIYLDGLEWGAPAWIGGIYSRNNIDYLIAFIKGAKTYHQIDMNFIGIWNERPNYTPEGLTFIRNLRAALDAENLSRVKIVGVDAITDWAIATHAEKNPALKAALGAVGVHYPSGYGLNTVKTLGFKYVANPVAQATGLPLYSSEDGPWTGTWEGAKAISRINNKNYIVNRITKTQYWSPVSSYYDVLSIPGSGVMYANQPWSGHYRIQPALWAIAHTTQFAQPGWKYVDSGCGLLGDSKGSYVTLKAPDGSGNYSIIIETTGFDKAQDVTFKVANLSNRKLHIWKSDAASQFVAQKDVAPTGGAFTMRLDPASIYSITTTTGQTKGGAVPPSSQSFPASYSDDFSAYHAGATPRYFQDQVGAFEVHHAPGKPSTLRQMLAAKPISWVSDVWPNTIIGRQDLGDFDVSTEALIEGATGQVGVIGRISAVPGYEQGVEPNGYALYLHEDGRWTLRKRGSTLAEGKVRVTAGAWQRLRLSFAGPRIRAFVNDAQVADVRDATYSSGLSGLATSWNTAQFKDIAIRSAR